MTMKKKLSKVWLLLALWLVAAAAHAGTHHYYYTDPQGTVLAKADASGTIIATYDYAPYGQAVASMSGAPDGPGYTGHVNDPETGLVYMQARYYDPAVGRFLSVDPVGVSPGDGFGFNRYAYVNNNPITNIDPTGRNACGTSDDGTCKVIVTIKDRAKDTGGNYNDSYTSVNSQNHYNALATVTVNGSITGTFLVKTTPSDSSTSATIANGTYAATLTTHSRAAAIRLQPTNAVPTIGPNSKHNGQSIASGILVHRSGINNLTGIATNGQAVSEGCQLVCRTQYGRFLGAVGITPSAGAPQRHFTVVVNTSENTVP
jgi:RHS repeat-associated protein